ncbi:MAG: hypothetical protein WAN51_11810 [Alphaproteobacteria bacterium]
MASGVRGRAGGEAGWQAARPRNEIRGQPLGWSGGRDMRQPGQDFVQHYLNLDARDMRASGA